MPDNTTPTSTTADTSGAETPETTEQTTDTGTTPADGSADPTKQAPKPPTLTPTQKKLVKSLKLKVDGKEYNEDLPFEIDPSDSKAVEYLTRQLQLSKMGQARSSETATLKKQVEGFINELRKNPRKVLNDPNLGLDFKKIVQEFIEEELQNSQKSPEQLKADQLEKEVARLKEENERRQQEFNAREFERLQQQALDTYDVQVEQALSKSDLPKSPYVVKKMADYMLLGLQQGMDVSPEDVIPLVRKEMQDDLKAMFAVMPEQVIEELIGKDTLKKLRTKNIAQAKGAKLPPPVGATKDVGVKQAPKPTEPKKKMSYKQMFGF